MTPSPHLEDADDDYGDDSFEWDESSDFDDADDESDTVPCGACGAEVYEDALQCPICNEYLSTGRTRRPMWFYVAVAITGLAALIVALS